MLCLAVFNKILSLLGKTIVDAYLRRVKNFVKSTWDNLSRDFRKKEIRIDKNHIDLIILNLIKINI